MPTPIITITGIIYTVIGLALACGGAWLVALGGSLYYVIAGLGILITGALLLGGRGAALWVYAAVFIGTLVWAVSDIGFDWWPLAARGDIIFPLGLWLLTPWITRGLGGGEALSYKAMTLPLWIGVVAAAMVLVIGLASNYNEIQGTIATASGGAAEGSQSGDREQPDADWRSYGRTQFGQRYSPLTQITPSNAKDLKVVWTFRTGDLRSGRDDLRGYAHQGARHSLPLLATSASVRTRGQDRQATLVLRS
jgi:quinoprotein glucose dehydrogenase